MQCWGGNSGLCVLKASPNPCSYIFVQCVKRMSVKHRSSVSTGRISLDGLSRDEEPREERDGVRWGSGPLSEVTFSLSHMIQEGGSHRMIRFVS